MEVTKIQELMDSKHQKLHESKKNFGRFIKWEMF